VLIRGLTRAGLVLVAGALGVLAWRAMIRAGMPAATPKWLWPTLGEALTSGHNLVIIFLQELASTWCVGHLRTSRSC
jgi:hypothetical protein